MGVLYLAALIVGLGVLGLQFVMSAGGDGDADAGGEADADGSAEHALDHHGHGHPEFGMVAVFLSLRFWSFGLLAFGLVGSALHFFALSGRWTAAIAATLMGLGSGWFATYTFHLLTRTQVSSGAEPGDAIGQVGRVMIPLERGKRGKIRLELRGQTVDLLASTDDEKLDGGELVVIEEIRGTTAHVSRATDGFLPKNGRSS